MDNNEKLNNIVRKSKYKIRRIKEATLPLWQAFLVILLLIWALVLIGNAKDEREKYRQSNETTTKSLQELRKHYDDLRDDLNRLEDKQSLQTQPPPAPVPVAVQPSQPAPVVRPKPNPQPVTHLTLDQVMAKNVMLQYWGEDQWAWMHELITRESNYRNVWNGSGSGACGIPQALPCSKLPQGINTPLDQQVHWMCNYIKNRYGTPQQAIAFHNQKGWY